MRQQPIFIAAIAIVFACSSCNNDPAAEERAMNAYLASADSIATSSSPGIAYLNSDQRKVIRKADIKCRVNNVPEAVHRLEAFAALADGFVQSSHTENNILNEKSISYKTDSLKTAQLYHTTANMVIRVPYYALDTLAAYISNMSTFMHHRDMRREDVTLQFLSNMLKNRAAADVGAAGSKPKPSVIATTQADERNVQQVDRRIANLGIQDDSRYATLSLELYQPAQVAVSVTQDADRMIAPAFADKAGNALAQSVDIIKSIILAAIATWPVWLSILLVTLWYRRGKLKKKTAMRTA